MLKKYFNRQNIIWSVPLLILLSIIVGLMFYWSDEPELFDVHEATQKYVSLENEKIIGAATTATLITVIETLLYKPGGYITNDKLPPGIFMDNMPNWEYGVLLQARDLTRSLRNDISRSQTQSTEIAELAKADPKIHFDHNSWLLPPTEGQYKQAIESLNQYLENLTKTDHTEAQFFARADNLRDWLALVEKRLGSLSQRLSASVGQQRINIDLGGDSAAEQSTSTPGNLVVKTPWHKIDDVFYEARGTSWALIHFFKAIEHDFVKVLEKKNALVSLKQIIRELEETQQFIYSPIILNGSGFGILANHSLVVSSYISKANAAVIDLRNLLEQG